jgi:hypothetical protein
MTNNDIQNTTQKTKDWADWLSFLMAYATTTRNAMTTMFTQKAYVNTGLDQFLF